MSRPKAFIKQSKAKKKAEQTLDTADDFLAAGVDFEEAAGKWRAGDGVKSMRFFSRAIEVYEQGLQRFPSSLDLTYNKARVLLEIATHPLLTKHLQSPLLDVLQQALEAHRSALALDQDNPDTLFNTAQVLTTIAEVYAKDPNHADQDALQPLEQALELQNRCLGIQELKLEESIRQHSEAAVQTTSEGSSQAIAEADVEKSDDSNGQSASNVEDQWFSIVEPVTKDTLIETILAELGTLTTLCSILGSAAASSSAPSLSWIEDFSSTLIKTKLPFLLEDAPAERVQEVALARANFVSSLLEAGYQLGSIDSDTYKRERDEAFRVPELDLERNFAALLANASSLVSFNAAVADSDPSMAPSKAVQRWNALSAAMTNMATASKISGPVPEDIAETHFVRGNCSLLQYQLGQPPVLYQPASANAAQLLKNADTFFRNASKLYQEPEQKAAAQIRAAVSQGLQSGTAIELTVLQLTQERGRDWVQNQIDDMVDDGLIPPQTDRA